MKRFAIPLHLFTTGYVYFIQMDRIGPIKIGFTKDVAKRILHLQVSSPYPLRVLCLFPGTEETERELHECYKDMKLEGEWFLPHPVILKDIEEILKHNQSKGFVCPIPEYDIDPDMKKHEQYYGHIKGKMIMWDDFYQSKDFQKFKRSKDSSYREAILDKYVVGSWL